MWFWFLVLVGVIIYMATKKDNSTKNTQFSNQQFNIEAHNRQWAEYILSYEQVVKTKSEKALLKRMLTDLARQGMLGGLQLLDDDGSAIEHETQNSSANSTSYNSENMQAAAGVTAPYVSVAPVPKTKAQVQLDNASLLLYFGAFLLVASAGLFVAFAGLPGGLRTFIVALVSVGMYYAGLWLYANRPKLRQAGTAFVGIGMAIMPLVGLAAYNYVFNKGNAPFAWLLTSVLCLAMYSHALYKLRTTFLDYLFIFTIVSLFESAVSITNLPLYYFGWMLAFIGIAVTLLARYGSIWKDLQTPSSVSSTLFIPISVLVSLALIGHDGLGQLGVSLLLAGFYYALCIATSVGSTQQTNAIAAQLSLVSGISVLAYALNKNISFTFAVVLSVSALQTLPILLWGEAVTDLRINFATTSIASYLGATVLAFGHPKLFLLAVEVLLVARL